LAFKQQPLTHSFYAGVHCDFETITVKTEWKLYLTIWGFTRRLLKAEENTSKKFRQEIHVLADIP
jgi:hypothetical protein